MITVNKILRYFNFKHDELCNEFNYYYQRDNWVEMRSIVEVIDELLKIEKRLKNKYK